jgi:anti-sigma factor RsiW
MGDCRDIESQLAAYVDGEVGLFERGRVEAHLERCPPCRARAATQRTAHDLLASHRDGLRGCASEALRHRCAAQRVLVAGRASFLGRRALVPLSLAASVFIAAALFVAFGWGSSVDTYAAQIVSDHKGCFQSPPEARAIDALALARVWEDTNGWPIKLLGHSEAENLQLLGLRRCGSSQGHVAHLLYRWHGRPLSVYVLNGAVKAAPVADHDHFAHETVTRQGEHAVVWSSQGRTYTVVASGAAADVERVAGYVRQKIE